MSSMLLYTLTGALLLLLGLLGFVLHSHLLRRLMAFNLMGSGCFLVMVGLAQHSAQDVDAVPQALVLTGIVVAVAATALALVLVRRWYHLTGEVTLPEDTPQQQEKS
ncbi:NADH-quinone oxidoreductase subunit K [Marinospirillum sp.]|uniref:NADH-quinone oxidoreductase subunit K n=1 Tax=Marinospirillum sp. TaxID=2183934 RepID=UPI003A83FF7C